MITRSYVKIPFRAFRILQSLLCPPSFHPFSWHSCTKPLATSVPHK